MGIQLIDMAFEGVLNFEAHEKNTVEKETAKEPYGTARLYNLGSNNFCSSELTKGWFTDSDIARFSNSYIIKTVEEKFEEFLYKYKAGYIFEVEEKLEYLAAICLHFILSNSELGFFARMKVQYKSFFCDCIEIIKERFLDEYIGPDRPANLRKVELYDIGLGQAAYLLMFDFFNSSTIGESIEHTDNIRFFSENKNKDNLINAITSLANDRILAAGFYFNAIIVPRYVIDDNGSLYYTGEQQNLNARFANVIEALNKEILPNSIFKQLKELWVTNIHIYKIEMKYLLLDNTDIDEALIDGRMPESMSAGSFILYKGKLATIMECIKMDPAYVLDIVFRTKKRFNPWLFYAFDSITLDVVCAYFKNWDNILAYSDYLSMLAECHDDSIYDDVSREGLEGMADDSDDWIDWNID